MQAHNENWLVSENELIEHLFNSGKSRGLLCHLPDAIKNTRKDENYKKNLDKLTEDQFVLFNTCLEVIGNPTKVVKFNYNIADSKVSRSILSTTSDFPGMWVTLAGSIDPLQLSIRSDAELRFLIRNILSALNADIRDTLLGCDLSTEAALGFLAILDQNRRSYLISMLRHLEPISVFSYDDIIDRLNEANEEDFRWAVTFVDKLLPFSVKDMHVAKDPGPALLELINAGIIKLVDEEQNSFTLTEAGVLLAETFRMSVSHVVISSAFFTEDKILIYEVFYFFRSATDLILVQLSGAEASIVSLLPSDLEALLSYIFKTPDLTLTSDYKEREEKSLSEEPTSDIESKVSRLKNNTNESAHQTEDSIKRFCRHCGQQLSPAATFCGQCGEKI